MSNMMFAANLLHLRHKAFWRRAGPQLWQPLVVPCRCMRVEGLDIDIFSFTCSEPVRVARTVRGTVLRLIRDF